jgi:hypothetical protein
MSLLTMVQQVALKVLKIPTSSIVSAVSSADPNILDIIGFLNEDGQELASRHTWQALRNEASYSTPGAAGGILSLGNLVGGAGYAGGNSSVFGFVPLTGGHGAGAIATVSIVSGVVKTVTLVTNTQGSGYQAGDTLSATAANLGGSGAGFSIQVLTVGIVGQTNQGTLQSILGTPSEIFGFIVNETMWDRSTRRPVFGPKSPLQWQQLQAQLMQGPWYQYTIRGNDLLMIPPPAPGDLIYFEWIQNTWCTNAGASQLQTFLQADTDVSLLDEVLHVLGGIWRFKEANGLPYQMAQDKYERRFADLTSRDGVKARLDLAGAQQDIYPGIMVPSGNWPIAGEPG